MTGKSKRKSKHTGGLQLDFFDLIENTFDGVWVSDATGTTLYINDTITEFNDVTRSEVIGKNVKDLMEQGVFSHSATVEAIETRSIATLQIQAKNGKTLLATARPLFNDDGSIRYIITNVRDITSYTELNNRLKEAVKLNTLYKNEILALKNQSPQAATFDFMLIQGTKQMAHAIEIAKRVAPTSETVLILGESGVGKEVLSRVIHALSDRATKAFITVNCGAISQELMESELFGHERGSFTSAHKTKVGLFELANKGTIFLDEIGELPKSMQVKLLRVLQERTIRRVGGTENIAVDVRVIAATNRNLEEMIGAGHFRQDLFYRLNVIPIQLRPVREHPEDVDIIVAYFLDAANKKYGYEKVLGADVVQAFNEYRWPGNIREIENTVTRLVLLCPYTIITYDYLPDAIRNSKKDSVVRGMAPLRTVVEEAEKRLLQLAAATCSSSREIAGHLRINHATVTRKMKKYGIAKP